MNNFSQDYKKPLMLIAGLFVVLLAVSYLSYRQQIAIRYSASQATDGRVEKTGKFIWRHWHDAQGGSSDEYSLETNTGENLLLEFADKNKLPPSGSTIKIFGKQNGKRITVSAQDAQSMEVTASTAIQSSLGDQRVLVILANFIDNSATPVSNAEAYGKLVTAPDSVNAYFKEVSFNQASVSADVVGWYTIQTTSNAIWGADCKNIYNSENFMAAADAVAQAEGVNVGSYSRKFYIMPKLAQCSWAGASSMGETPSYAIINGSYPENDPSIYAHEFGHQFGLYHASALLCGNKTIDAYANCTVAEYWDPYSVMGGSPVLYHLNAPHKVQLGYIPSTRVQTVSTSGTYTIAPLENSTADIQVLKIAKPDTSENYYLNYRLQSGFDSSLPAAIANTQIFIWDHPGVLLNLRSWLLDQNPAAPQRTDSSLIDGRSFHDPANGITITQLSHNTTGATVEVTFTVAPPPPPDSIAPIVSITSPLNGAKLKGSSTTIKANATDNVGVIKIELYIDGVFKSQTTASSLTYKWNFRTAANGAHTILVKAFDAAGNVGTKQITVTK